MLEVLVLALMRVSKMLRIFMILMQINIKWYFLLILIYCMLVKNYITHLYLKFDYTLFVFSFNL